MTWNYSQPVEIILQSGIMNQIDDFLTQRGFTKGILVCDEFFVTNGQAKTSKNLIAIFSDIQPNPTLENAQDCACAIQACGAEFVLAFGGGSVLDCAKIAAALAKTGQTAARVHSGEESLKGLSLPVIAVPTTSGTGSEVTPVSVLTDTSLGLKSSVVHPCLFPKLAIIDPELTISMPPALTAITGLDALAHALEGFWSINNQPICDALSLAACRKIFQYLPIAFSNGSDLRARTEMCEASVLAGLAFALPRTAGSHACSYTFTTEYGISHGEACAFTLAAFTRINAAAHDGRLNTFAEQLGFSNANEMAYRIDEIKKEMGMIMTLGQLGIARDDIPELVKKSKHPNLLNNPVEMTDEKLTALYESLL